MDIRNPVLIFEDHAVLLSRHRGRTIRILVSREDLELLSAVKRKWHVRWSPTASTFYAQTKVGGRMIQMHRYIAGLSVEDARVPDHLDFNGVNNLRSNLRVTTRSINQHHCRPRITNTSGYVGVSRDRRRDKFLAGMNYTNEAGQRRYKFLGYFDDPAEASKVREAFIAKLGECV